MNLLRPRRHAAALFALSLTLTAALSAPPATARAVADDIATFTAGDRHLPGYLDLYWSPDDARLRIALPADGRDAIYVNYLAGGVGSNDIGLDRGQIGGSRYVRFEVHADRVLVVQPNMRYRARSGNPDEIRAVEEAFASSILASLPIVARTGGTVLADVTDFALTDVHGVAQRLASRGQGTFKADPGRSVILDGQLAAFPRNTVIEARLTFSGSNPGEWLREVTPTPQALSVRIRHDFVAPPPDGYRTRPYHPRSGGFARSFVDFAAPLEDSLEQPYVVRHRLQRAAGGDGAESPIVYYVDRGAPEPVRSALLEGAAFWRDAFAAAGFEDGFRVELMPAGASPLDVRYNVIQWVHRATRGWSYGSSVVDPRTGEIIKGHVTLGSQRVRQDLLIAEALSAPFGDGGDDGAAARELALARLRQLAAHEVGHTLGLAHNFAASTQDDASVMDYPHPYLRLTESGTVDLSAAYSDSIGPWDVHAIRYLYTPFSGEEEAAGLAAIVREAADLAYLSDADARNAATSATPMAHLWDNGVDPVQRLDELMRIRARALDGFSAAVLRDDRQLFEAEARLVPVYLLHRYQLGAVVKSIGGLEYGYGLRRESPPAATPVAAADQRQALEGILATLTPSALRLGANVIAVMHPPGPHHRRDREYFTHATARVFDPLAPARAAAQLGATLLLDPTRAQRLVNQHMLDASLPGLREVLERIAAQLIRIEADTDYEGMIARETAWTFLRELQRLTVAERASDPVRSLARDTLADLEAWAAGRNSAYARRVAATLATFLDAPDASRIPPRHTVPPGSPI